MITSQQLLTHFPQDLTPIQAFILSGVLNGIRSPEMVQGFSKWNNEYTIENGEEPGDDLCSLWCANAILKGHGIGEFRPDPDSEITIRFVKFDNPHEPTIVYDVLKDEFRIGSSPLSKI